METEDLRDSTLARDRAKGGRENPEHEVCRGGEWGVGSNHVNGSTSRLGNQKGGRHGGGGPWG